MSLNFGELIVAYANSISPDGDFVHFIILICFVFYIVVSHFNSSLIAYIIGLIPLIYLLSSKIIPRYFTTLYTSDYLLMIVLFTIILYMHFMIKYSSIKRYTPYILFLFGILFISQAFLFISKGRSPIRPMILAMVCIIPYSLLYTFILDYLDFKEIEYIFGGLYNREYIRKGNFYSKNDVRYG